MTRSIQSLWLGVIVVLGTSFAGAAASVKEAEALERALRRTTSLEAFGRSVVQQALTKAAESLREGGKGPISLDVSFEVRIEPLPYSPPSPHEIDVCWEICPQRGSFWQCYIDCSAPVAIQPPLRPIRDCDAIWADYNAATDLFRRMELLKELIARSCLRMEAVRLEIEQRP